jgi:hypothetical protein
VSALYDRVLRRIEEVGECYEWTGAFSGRVPAIVWKGKTLNVRRALADDMRVSKAIGRDKVAASRCGNWRCVRLEHIQVITRKALQQRTAKKAPLAARMVGQRKISNKARQRGKLTVEIASAIRESTDTQREIAKRYGVSQATVYAIRKGLTWRQYGSPFEQLIGAVT